MVSIASSVNSFVVSYQDASRRHFTRFLLSSQLKFLGFYPFLLERLLNRIINVFFLDRKFDSQYNGQNSVITEDF